MTFSPGSLYLSIDGPQTSLDMAKKKKTIYTTIQIRKELNEYIKRVCKEYGLVASTVTENYWSKIVSSSVSGSIIL